MCGQTCQSTSDERRLPSYRVNCLEGECALTSLLISYGLQPLNQMALINESIDEAISDLSNKRNPTKASSATHSDLSKSSLHKNIAAFTKLLCWFKDTADFDESENENKMLAFSTGLISQKGNNNVNAEDCFSVGTALQKELDGKSFIDKFRVKGKVRNLTLLNRTVMVSEKDIVRLL